MKNMMKRRTLLSALPFVFAAACARAQGSRQASATTSDMSGMSGDTLSALTGGLGKVVWLAFAGTVRLTVANANARPASLQRAIMLGPDGTSARVFDIWQVGDAVPVAGPSLTRGIARSETGPNDAGTASVWLTRSFTHPALQAPIENSRLARDGSRVIAIDATQIWVVEGGIAAAAPVLTGAALTAFDAWRVG